MGKSEKQLPIYNKLKIKRQDKKWLAIANKKKTGQWQRCFSD